MTKILAQSPTTGIPYPMGRFYYSGGCYMVSLFGSPFRRFAWKDFKEMLLKLKATHVVIFKTEGK